MKICPVRAKLFHANGRTDRCNEFLRTLQKLMVIIMMRIITIIIANCN